MGDTMKIKKRGDDGKRIISIRIRENLVEKLERI